MLKSALIAICFALGGLTFVSSTPVSAEDKLPPISAQGQAEVDRLMEPFFQTLKAGDTTKAYADILKGTLLEGKTTEVAQLASQTSFVITTYGAITSWEVIKSECVTPDFCKITYLIRAAEGPIGFWAYVYRQPTGVWEPNYVLFGTTPQFFFD